MKMMLKSIHIKPNAQSTQVQFHFLCELEERQKKRINVQTKLESHFKCRYNRYNSYFRLR